MYLLYIVHTYTARRDERGEIVIPTEIGLETWISLKKAPGRPKKRGRGL